MKNLWFENSNGEERLIAAVETWKDVWYCIDEFIKQCNEHKPADKQFKSYYRRTWREGNRMAIDVGSWSEFFYTDLPYEEENLNDNSSGCEDIR